MATSEPAPRLRPMNNASGIVWTIVGILAIVALLLYLLGR